MSKYLIVLRPNEVSETLTYGSFSAQILDEVIPLISTALPESLKVFITSSKPPTRNLFRFQKSKAAVIHLTGNREIVDHTIDLLKDSFNGQVFGYVVEESHPMSYDRDWQDGARTPMPLVVTLLKRKKGMSIDEFAHYWQKVYSPLALSIIPIWHYERNLVVESLNLKNPEIDGVVAETCATKSELLNPIRFFGGFLNLIPNLWSIQKAVNSFLELNELEVFYMEETWIKS